MPARKGSGRSGRAAGLGLMGGHHPPPHRRPRQAARRRAAALPGPDAGRARTAADDALAARAGEEGRWSLGVLRPLTPAAPGTYRYLVTFAAWESDGDGFARRDVHGLTVWATDAGSARRLAHEEAQAVPGYRPAWRVRRVVRVPEAEPA
jgi:hypothetical protein